MNLYEAAVLVRLSPELLSWFCRYAPKSGDDRKLPFTKDADGELELDEDDLRALDAYLREPWPCAGGRPCKKGQRPGVPVGITRDLKEEHQNMCAYCARDDCETAHIDPVSSFRNNHPHNLLRLCELHHGDYDKRGTLSRADLIAKKKALIDARVSFWRVQARGLIALLSYVRSLEKLAATAEIPDEVLTAYIAVANDSIRAHTAELSDVVPADFRSPQSIEELADFRRHIADERGLADCPLCDGSGSHNNWECPVCSGEGTVNEDDLREIDLSGFEQEECPLCEGSGSHNNWECPVCRGVGTVDKDDLREIDLGGFDQEECPLCEGSGSHNTLECPVCRGVGTVDKDDLREIDLGRFEQEECPLCEGSGSHNTRECPVCRGVRTVDRYMLDDFDPAYFETD